MGRGRLTCWNADEWNDACQQEQPRETDEDVATVSKETPAWVD
jgi:hypothetical protein